MNDSNCDVICKINCKYLIDSYLLYCDLTSLNVTSVMLKNHSIRTNTYKVRGFPLLESQTKQKFSASKYEGIDPHGFVVR